MFSRRGSVTLGVALTLLAALWSTPRSATAQAFFIDAQVNQGFADDPLPSPVGFSFAMGRTSILGPWGIHAGLRQLYEDGEEQSQYCNFDTCTPGPFDQTHAMRLIYVGVSYDYPNPTDVYLNLGVNVGRTQQTERLAHTMSGEEMKLSGGDETTLGGAVDLRLRPFIGPLRPAFTARYDRIFQADCVADGICFPARDLWSVSVGLSWVAPIR